VPVATDQCDQCQAGYYGSLCNTSCPALVISEGVATVDVEGLYDSLGEEWFRSVGGIVETRPALSIDKKRVMAYAESGTIPKEVVDKYIKVTPRLSKPNKVSLP
jgi:hypothetical protein